MVLWFKSRLLQNTAKSTTVHSLSVSYLSSLLPGTPWLPSPCTSRGAGSLSSLGSFQMAPLQEALQVLLPAECFLYHSPALLILLYTVTQTTASEIKTSKTSWCICPLSLLRTWLPPQVRRWGGCYFLKGEGTTLRKFSPERQKWETYLFLL